MRRARVIFAACLGLFGIVLGLVLSDATLSADRAIATDMTSWTGPEGVRLRAMRLITALGSSRWLWPIASAAVIGFVIAKRHRAGMWIVITALVGSGLNSLVKTLTDRPRPAVALIDAGGLSFPSGHAMNSMIVYGAIVLALWPLLSAGRARALLAAVTVLVSAIGFTRIALGVHYMTDVVGAFALGGAWLAAADMARVRWRIEYRTPHG